MFCGHDATMMVEAESLPDSGLCDEHYEAMIRSAEKHNPKATPGTVRSCMERASYPAVAR